MARALISAQKGQKTLVSSRGAAAAALTKVLPDVELGDALERVQLAAELADLLPLPVVGDLSREVKHLYGDGGLEVMA